ncbi:MAG: 5-formyltetrahydrofolate cyclo-ligase [Inconstantimicrobium porci]|uniref:5-formyltetrahydrofolate cyclo-ligase n=1 Tax=Inconstantimicrobium porci TaxID=2652291 RepID=UPI0024094649|nr:5-formyltetrahydrofolate cyclo-ligase [Inconstantimicrobium porci]MDD6771106.1 5-formyltetrahydrofolate cyclo-ligase [Inconstantimicrobium porci]MDY5910565.1 5-formyltetrahydrofolate cyclo-ligase [Inconstantimicrobium porci]
MKYKVILDNITKEFRCILRDNLTGIYVHGSIAFGCFNFKKSDIDFIVVVKDKISQTEKMALMKVIYDMQESFPEKGIEMSVVLEEYCRNFKCPTPFELHFSNMHLKRYEEDPDNYCRTMNGDDIDLAAHFTVIKECGLVWYGKKIDDVFGDIPQKYYMDSIKDDIMEAEKTIITEPIYTVLNLCRVLSYIKTGKVMSKQQGGIWAADNLDEKYVHIIIQALQCYGSDEEMFIDKKESGEFCSFMFKQILIEEKKNVRNIIKAKKEEFLGDVSRKEEYDRQLVYKLTSSDIYKKAENIFCYIGMNDEIDTSILIEKAIEDGKNISVPKVTGKITMDAVIIDSLAKLKPVKPYGILEPIDDKDKMDKIDLIIVPGLAFDNQGGRVGHGAGYYDYFIKRHKEAHTVALCYDFQVIDKVPEEEHDVKIEKIIY